MAQQFNVESDKISTLVLQPEQYEGVGKRGANQKVAELNSSLRSRDNLVNQVKELYKQIPKTREFASQIKKFKEIIKNNPTGLQVTLDRDARGGKGSFKFNKGKLSDSDKLLLAELNKEFDFEKESSTPSNLMERLLNIQGAMASPNTDPQSNVQPIDLF